ncbi:hypothetical protein PCASD_22139 [Puccinia coronata f. sp. avenae]|uniref:Uncharacterized protein n=1 Tax=Puccinia coronata f. sp. avenae TaxID=200324 RepID=A0A2N5TNV1_9BASI|nr:hypothetical protein PCASD_22139 [Puccinia coronata f. sp. avenae]
MHQDLCFCFPLAAGHPYLHQEFFLDHSKPLSNPFAPGLNPQRPTALFASSGSAVFSGPVTRTGDNDKSNKDNDAKTNENSLFQHNSSSEKEASGSEKEDGGSEKEDGGSEKEDKKGGTKTHIYYVPCSRQHDLNQNKAITSLETLKLYRRLSFGTCIIVPIDKPSFCKLHWISFKSILVKKNGAQTGGTINNVGKRMEEEL